MIQKDQVFEEISFCLKLWEKQGWCSFGNGTTCEQCSALSVLWKLYSGEVLDGQKLGLDDWKEKVNK